MPNYITNRLRIEGNEQEVNEVLDFLKSEEKERSGKNKVIDFNNIIPLPVGVDWYEWCIANWGTKWNAIGTELIDTNVIMFDTAWSGVPELMQKLSSKFPNVTLHYDFADEDFGYNVGSFIIKNNEIVEGGYLENESVEAYEMLFSLKPYAEEYFELVDGEYKYREEIEE